MADYLYGTSLTNEAVAANNRGDNIGNTTTLQKIFHQDDVHTSVSAETIRFSWRYRFQLENINLVNRTFDYEPQTGKLKLLYKDEKVSYWNDPNRQIVYIDDDLMGFMDAEAASKEKEEMEEEEQEDSTAKKKSRSKKAKGKVTLRPSPLAVGRAVSLRPYRGELSFNCVSGEKQKGELSLYSAEMHTTEYQYSFGLNLGDVVKKEHIKNLIDAIIDPPPVAGNHARFAYDFSPASIIFRLTNAHSSRIQNCFEHDEENRTYTIEKLIRKVKSGDIPADELIIGGDLFYTEEGEQLREKYQVTMFEGVYAAANEVLTRIANLGGDYRVVKPQTETETQETNQ
ncbi:CRISPR-associated regulatory protein, DevR family (plasmid) [Gloeothece citriformis PCC 7424]|uniref:CRISPR-associated regulatory protein, DevR family n=1 Tax=Gloeothece citriformis (strain PCC 7424) TaxID=65393 RepID=B7KMR8_GLOC7|nr:DevR family CRISPR-associated autoregulator [Gloeothece citriformis]ACK74090.1 CRISPR-associated regulatory protein, DevR family [Gloeothece citriformis PCC 7424]